MCPLLELKHYCCYYSHYQFVISLYYLSVPGLALKYQRANNYLRVHVGVDAVRLVSDTQWMTVLIPTCSDVMLQLFACCGTCHAHEQTALACSRLPLPGVATSLSRLSYGHVAATLRSGIRSADRELLRLPMKVSLCRTAERLWHANTATAVSSGIPFQDFNILMKQ